MSRLASVQTTTLDVAWIRDGVVCLGSRPGDRRYRAALVAEAPPEAFAAELDRVQPVLHEHARFLNAFAQPGALPPATLQVLVRTEPGNLAAYAARLETRADALPPHLAREALADAGWARQAGPLLGLLERRSYVVVPAEALPEAGAGTRLATAGAGLRRWLGRRPPLDEAAARRALDARCAELIDRLGRSGVWAQRLDDVGVARLYHACWSRRRNGRFERDLAASAQPLVDGRS